MSSTTPHPAHNMSTTDTTPDKPELPWAFHDCPTDTLVILISHMLDLLMQHNDQVQLTPDALTRFHSRAAPGISVIEYLRRIVKYTNMEVSPLFNVQSISWRSGWSTACLAEAQSRDARHTPHGQLCRAVEPRLVRRTIHQMLQSAYSSTPGRRELLDYNEADDKKIPLLSLLAYIDLTCANLPTFTLSTLTVHRFLIAGVCAGSKAQCDVFCTNAHYAKVGGIKVQELNALEREFLRVTQWALCVSHHASILGRV